MKKSISVPDEITLDFVLHLPVRPLGKYCHVLRAWLVKNRDKARRIGPPRAYIGDGNINALDPYAQYSDRSSIWLGWSEGTTIPGVSGICPSRYCNLNLQERSEWSFCVRREDLIDVTDLFWRMYVAQGRCFLLPNLVHQWVKINRNSRKCSSCLLHQRREVCTESHTRRFERWEEAV